MSERSDSSLSCCRRKERTERAAGTATLWPRNERQGSEDIGDFALSTIRESLGFTCAGRAVGGGSGGGGGRGRRRRRRDRGEGVSRRADQEHNVSHMGPIDMSSRHAIHARPAPWSWPTRRPALAHTQPKVLVGVGAELFARLDSKNLGTGGAKQRIFGAGGETWLDSCCHTPSVPARTYLGRRLVSFKEQLLLTVVGLWYPLCFRCFC